MKNRALLSLLIMTGCSSPGFERSLQVSATEVEEGTLIETRLFSGDGEPLVLPEVLLDEPNREAALWVGPTSDADGADDPGEDGIHALILVEGGEVSVEAWQVEQGAETWRTTQRTTVRLEGRCSNPERWLRSRARRVSER